MRPGQNWRDLMPACTCCGRVMFSEKSFCEIPGLGVMHAHCGWEVEKIAQDLLNVRSFRHVADVINLAYTAQNEIVISMVAEWMVEWIKEYEE